MALIKVRFYSLLSRSLGADTVTLQADDVEEALLQLEQTFGSRIRRELEGEGIRLDGEIRDYGLILLNGTNVRNLKSTDLRDGDTLHVFPRAIGG